MSLNTHAALLLGVHAVTAAAFVAGDPLAFWAGWGSSCLLAVALLARTVLNTGWSEQDRTAAVLGALYLGAHYAEDIHRRAGGGSLFLTTATLVRLEGQGVVQSLLENDGDGRRGYYLVPRHLHHPLPGRS